MGIFSRFKDIIGSNINAMLEGAEDPEKLARLMIKEMEDTLIEMKSGCARTMADAKRADRVRDSASAKAAEWGAKAELAMSKGREDLAREALLNKRSYKSQEEALQKEATELNDLVEQYRKDIAQVEDKLTTAREKHRVLVQRQVHATKSKTAQTRMRKVDNTDSILRFEDFEHRIDRLEAEATLVAAPQRKSSTLQDEFDRLIVDDELEQEIQELRSRVNTTAAS